MDILNIGRSFGGQVQSRMDRGTSGDQMVICACPVGIKTAGSGDVVLDVFLDWVLSNLPMSRLGDGSALGERSAHGEFP